MALVLLNFRNYYRNEKLKHLSVPVKNVLLMVFCNAFCFWGLENLIIWQFNENYELNKSVLVFAGYSNGVRRLNNLRKTITFTPIVRNRMMGDFLFRR